MKKGLPVPERKIPKLETSRSNLKIGGPTSPDRFFSPIPDNRDYILQKMRQEQESLLITNKDPKFIERK